MSLETVNVCIVNYAGDVLLEKKIEAEPTAIIGLLDSFGQPFKRIGLEAGLTSSWLYQRVALRGLPRDLPRVPPRKGGAERHEEQDGPQ